MNETVVGIIVLWCAFGSIAGLIMAARARSHFRSPWKWFLVGFALGGFGPFALAGWFFVPKNREMEQFRSD